MHSYQAESDVELNLSIGDFVVVRKVYSMLEFNISVVSNSIDNCFYV